MTFTITPIWVLLRQISLLLKRSNLSPKSAASSISQLLITSFIHIGLRRCPRSLVICTVFLVTYYTLQSMFARSSQLLSMLVILTSWRSVFVPNPPLVNIFPPLFSTSRHKFSLGVLNRFFPRSSRFHGLSISFYYIYNLTSYFLYYQKISINFLSNRGSPHELSCWTIQGFLVTMQSGPLISMGRLDLASH